MWINAFLALNMSQSPLLAYWLSEVFHSEQKCKPLLCHSGGGHRAKIKMY